MNILDISLWHIPSYLTLLEKYSDSRTSFCQGSVQPALCQYQSWVLTCCQYCCPLNTENQNIETGLVGGMGDWVGTTLYFWNSQSRLCAGTNIVQGQTLGQTSTVDDSFQNLVRRPQCTQCIFSWDSWQNWFSSCILSRHQHPECRIDSLKE